MEPNYACSGIKLWIRCNSATWIRGGSPTWNIAKSDVRLDDGYGFADEPAERNNYSDPMLYPKPY